MNEHDNSIRRGKRVISLEPISFLLSPSPGYDEKIEHGTIVYHHREGIMYKIVWDGGGWSDLEDCEFGYCNPGDDLL